LDDNIGGDIFDVGGLLLDGLAIWSKGSVKLSDPELANENIRGERGRSPILTCLNQMLAKTTLPRIRFHDLRHAHATHLLSSGVHPKVASERLGHSKVGITLDLYSHVLPGMQADAAARVDEALRVALQKRAR